MKAALQWMDIELTVTQTLWVSSVQWVVMRRDEV